MSRSHLSAIALLAVFGVPALAGAQSAKKKTTKSTVKHTTSSAATSPWHTAYSDSRVSVSIDPSKTVKNADGSYTTHLRWKYASSQQIGHSQSYRTMVETRMIECDSLRSKAVEAETFDGSDKHVSGYSASPEEVSELAWTHRKPGTSGAKAYAGVCRSIKKKA